MALPTIRQLEILLALARTSSFSKAAQIMGMSQSALSQSIAQMEFLTDVQLVHRTRRSVALTRAGQAFVQRAETIVGDLQSAVREAHDEADPGQGRVVLTCLSSVILRILPSVTRAFRKRWPSATLVIREDDPALCIKQVKTGTADVAIAMMLTPDPAVEFRPLLEDRFRFVCNHRHSLSGREVVEWSELAEYDFVGMPQWLGVRQMADGLIPGYSSRRRAIYEVSRVPTVLSIVEEADVVSAIPALLLADPYLSDRVHHCPIVSPVVTRRLGVITSRNAPPSATTAAFCDLLFETVAASQLFEHPDVSLPLDARHSTAHC